MNTKTITIQAIITYKVEVPADWTAQDVVSHRNESCWCSSNLLEELKALDDKSCLCEYVTFQCVKED